MIPLLDGKATDLTFACAEAGDYQYTLRLADDYIGKDGYDQTVYILYVSVDPQEDGTLGYVITAEKGTSRYKPESLSFSNEPTPPRSVEVTIGHIVHYDGPPHRPETTFELHLIPVDGAPMPDGMEELFTSVKLSEEQAQETAEMTLIFTDPGIYRYTLHEETGNETGVIYDETLYDIVVEVIENPDGSLSATWRAYVPGNSNPITSLEHWNTWSDTEPSPSPSPSVSPSPSPSQSPSPSPSPSPSVSPSPSPKATIPQTGTLLWLVPCFLVIGFLLISVGIILGRRRRNG